MDIDDAPLRERLIEAPDCDYSRSLDDTFKDGSYCGDAGEFPTRRSVLNFFRSYVAELRSGFTDTAGVTFAGEAFVLHDALVFVLLCPDRTDADLNDVARLADIYANAFCGTPQSEDTATVVMRIWHATTVVQRHFPDSVEKAVAFIVDKLCTNFGWVAEFASNFSTEAHITAVKYKRPLEPIVKNLPLLRQPALLKIIFNHLSGKQADETLGAGAAYSCRDAVAKVLLDCRALARFESYTNLICWLSISLKQEELVQILCRCLDLWGDPVISRGHVVQEIIHYTKVAFVTFTHVAPSELSPAIRGRIVERLVKGTPNHFNSSDPRTVVLAQFLCRLVTDSLSHFDNPEENKIDDEVQTPNDELCRDVLDSFHLCGNSKHFWHRPVPVEKMEELKLEPLPADTMPLDAKRQISDDDDDDSDLEPIESLDAPVENNIKFLRNFLEKFPELEKYDEVKSALITLPNLIQHQLGLEHEDIGREVLESVYFFENQFDATDLDDSRKTCLGTVLKTHLPGNLQHFVEFFHREHVQPWRKNLVLDVVYNVSKEASLKDLQTIARCVFRQLLVDERTLNDQDAIVRIPFVLFLGRVICLLPEIMVEEEMVVKYLSSLTNLRDVDGATEQTVKYSLNNVMRVIGHLQFTPKVNDSIRDTREWLMDIEAAR